MRTIENLEGEVWAAIAQTRGCFEVSNMGRVKRVDQTIPTLILGVEGTRRLPEMLINPWTTRFGYMHVKLQLVNYRVHRLVAQAFRSNTLRKPHINHLDGIKSNNHADNLEWCTARENQIHASENGLIQGNRTSEHVGVSWNSHFSKFESRLSIDGKKYNLGAYNDEDLAGRAYRVALYEYNTFGMLPQPRFRQRMLLQHSV